MTTCGVKTIMLSKFSCKLNDIKTFPNFTSLCLVVFNFTSIFPSAMNFHGIFLLCHFIAFSLASSKSIAIENSSSEKSIVLSEIIAKYLINYFSVEETFVSIILAASNNDQLYFQNDLFAHLFKNPSINGFTHNVLNKMDVASRNHRNTINLIFIDDIKSLP